MKINKLMVAVVLGCAGLSGTALAQVNEITQVVTAEILAPTAINLEQIADMTFEATTANNSEQTVDAVAAAYTVSGDDRGFTIDTSASSTELVLTAETIPGAGDGVAMPFTVTASADAGTIVSGTADITVAGSIIVAADQAAGIYEGDLVVTVAYE